MDESIEILVLIDGQNFDGQLIALGKKHNKKIKIDFDALRSILNPSNQPCASYYIARDTGYNPFYAALKNLGFTVIQPDSYNLRNGDPWDDNQIKDIIASYSGKGIKKIYLFAGDGGYAEALRKAFGDDTEIHIIALTAHTNLVYLESQEFIHEDIENFINSNPGIDKSIIVDKQSKPEYVKYDSSIDITIMGYDKNDSWGYLIEHLSSEIIKIVCILKKTTINISSEVFCEDMLISQKQTNINIKFGSIADFKQSLNKIVNCVDNVLVNPNYNTIDIDNINISNNMVKIR